MNVFELLFFGKNLLATKETPVLDRPSKVSFEKLLDLAEKKGLENLDSTKKMLDPLSKGQTTSFHHLSKKTSITFAKTNEPEDLDVTPLSKESISTLPRSTKKTKAALKTTHSEVFPKRTKVDRNPKKADPLHQNSIGQKPRKSHFVQKSIEPAQGFTTSVEQPVQASKERKVSNPASPKKPYTYNEAVIEESLQKMQGLSAKYTKSIAEPNISKKPQKSTAAHPGGERLLDRVKFRGVEPDRQKVFPKNDTRAPARSVPAKEEPGSVKAQTSYAKFDPHSSQKKEQPIDHRMESQPVTPANPLVVETAIATKDQQIAQSPKNRASMQYALNRQSKNIETRTAPVYDESPTIGANIDRSIPTRDRSIQPAFERSKTAQAQKEHFLSDMKTLDRKMDTKKPVQTHTTAQSQPGSGSFEQPFLQTTAVGQKIAHMEAPTTRIKPVKKRSDTAKAPIKEKMAVELSTEPIAKDPGPKKMIDKEPLEKPVPLQAKEPPALHTAQPQTGTEEFDKAPTEQMGFHETPTDERFEELIDMGRSHNRVVRLQMEDTRINISYTHNRLNLTFVSPHTLMLGGEMEQFVHEVMQESGFERYRVQLKERNRTVTVESKKESGTSIRRSGVDVKV